GYLRRTEEHFRKAFTTGQPAELTNRPSRCRVRGVLNRLLGRSALPRRAKGRCPAISACSDGSASEAQDSSAPRAAWSMDTSLQKDYLPLAAAFPSAAKSSRGFATPRNW